MLHAYIGGYKKSFGQILKKRDLSDNLKNRDEEVKL